MTYDGPTCQHCGARFKDGRFIDQHKPGCPAAVKVSKHSLEPAYQPKAQKQPQEDKKVWFMEMWPEHYPPYEIEYRFAALATGGTGNGVRKRLADAGYYDWRFDLAWPDYLVAVGVDGNAWWVKGGGRHMKDDDLMKHNIATLLGWRFFHFSPNMVKSKGDQCVALIYNVLQAIKGV